MTSTCNFIMKDSSVGNDKAFRNEEALIFRMHMKAIRKFKIA